MKIYMKLINMVSFITQYQTKTEYPVRIVTYINIRNWSYWYPSPVQIKLVLL